MLSEISQMHAVSFNSSSAWDDSHSFAEIRGCDTFDNGRCTQRNIILERPETEG